LGKAHHLGVEEGLIPKEQQHRAAAGSSSTGQTGGSISSLSFKRQASLLEGQLHSWEKPGSPQEDGRLKPITEHVNFSRLWEEELPSFARGSSALKLAVRLLWHALNSLCACQRNWSA